jgi:hypothetical protein
MGVPDARRMCLAAGEPDGGLDRASRKPAGTGRTVQAEAAGPTWAPGARTVGKRPGESLSIPTSNRHSSFILSCSCYLHGCPCRHQLNTG